VLNVRTLPTNSLGLF